jgi:hypothetical protein
MGKRRARRETEIFSISFLDCITCGLGSVVLLLVLSDVRSPEAKKEQANLTEEVAKLKDELIKVTTDRQEIENQLSAQDIELKDEKAILAKLQADLTKVRGQFNASKKEAEVVNELEGKLSTAQQSLTDEMKRLLAQKGDFRRRKDDAIGGIPVDSEYIIFIIDTSGSMFNYVWNMMLKTVGETLDVYPTVKGLQVMSDEGGYLFPSYRGKWIPDNPAQRKLVIDKLRTFNVFSNSSPIEGINEAIRTYSAPDKRISLYVFGDEFTGASIDSVVKTVDVLNREDTTGERRVRIHAVGFPVRPEAPQITSIRFATLMRILCAKNGGAFVGLNEPDRPSSGGFRIGSTREPLPELPSLVLPSLQQPPQIVAITQR